MRPTPTTTSEHLLAVLRVVVGIVSGSEHLQAAG